MSWAIESRLTMVRRPPTGMSMARTLRAPLLIVTVGPDGVGSGAVGELPQDPQAVRSR